MTAAEQVLYTDRDGERALLTEVISDGIEGGYEDRLPQLRELCEHGAHRPSRGRVPDARRVVGARRAARARPLGRG